MDPDTGAPARRLPLGAWLPKLAQAQFAAVQPGWRSAGNSVAPKPLSQSQVIAEEQRQHPASQLPLRFCLACLAFSEKGKCAQPACLPLKSSCHLFSGCAFRKETMLLDEGLDFGKYCLQSSRKVSEKLVHSRISAESKSILKPPRAGSSILCYGFGLQDMH